MRRIRVKIFIDLDVGDELGLDEIDMIGTSLIESLPSEWFDDSNHDMTIVETSHQTHIVG